jgi:hypothetical protein
VGAYRPNRCCFVYRRAGKRGDDERSKIHSTPLLPRTGARRGHPGRSYYRTHRFGSSVPIQIRFLVKLVPIGS